MQKTVYVAAAALLLSISLALVGAPPADAGWCNGRSSASLADLEIRWESVDYVFKSTSAVATGASAEEVEEAAETSPFLQLDKPVVVYVCPSGGGGEDYQKLEEIVFKDEKVGLSTKAFRCVKIRPELLEKDPVLAEEGSEIPRLLVIDPVREDVDVLEKGNLKASKFVKSMERAAKKYYKESLSKIVKEHLKLLTEQDQLYNEEKVLKNKEGRLAEEGKSAEKKLEDLREELAELQKEIEAVKAKVAELWKLTPRAQA